MSLAGIILGDRSSDCLASLRAASAAGEIVLRDARRWSAMREYFAGAPEQGDPLIYEIYTWNDGHAPTNLLSTITVLHAGRIGDEFYHTKGHFHTDPDGSEFVVGYFGEGVLQTGTRAGAVTETQIMRGAHLVIPDSRAHRVVNRGEEAAVYLSVSSAGVGHDYDSVSACGWRG